MAHFESWLQQNGYLENTKSIFTIDSMPEQTPLWIIAWIMSQFVFLSSVPFFSLQIEDSCDIIKPNGCKKDPGTPVSTYTHAMKLRSSLTYGFGRNHRRGKRDWILNSESGEWNGNPSVSIQVARYMVALRKRKVSAVSNPIFTSGLP